MGRFEACDTGYLGIGRAHDEIVGDPVDLDPMAGGVAYVIRTVVDVDGRHTVEYADPDEA